MRVISLPPGPVSQSSGGDSCDYDRCKQQGDCYAELADYARAREFYERAACLSPASAEPHIALGSIALQQGELGAARLSFERARRLDDAGAEAYRGLAMVYQQQEDYPAAFDMYLRCLELNQDNLVALLGLFQTSCLMGTFAKIIGYLELYLRKHPRDSSVLFCLASLYAREGKLSQARDALLDVLAQEPDKPEASEMLQQISRCLARSAN